MFSLHFPVDPKLAAAIERRRIREEERKRRILDDKKRRIGIDVSALTKQIEERKQLELMQRMYEKDIEQELLLQDKMAVKAHQREVEHKRRFDRAIDKFRLMCQRPETQRDFDLNDPHSLKKERPPRHGDDDQFCGPSSLQKFAGEDIWKNERERRLQQLQKMWLENQRQEKLAYQQHLKDIRELQDAEVIQQDRQAQEEMHQEKSYRKSLEKSIQNYNQKLLFHKTTNQRLMKQRELELNIEDMENHIFSDILAEDASMAISAFGPHRVIPDRWKGMSSAQVEQILQYQREQAINKKLINAAEKQQESAWDHQMMLQMRSDLLQERERQRKSRDYHRQLMEENKRLAAEQRRIQQELNQNVYRENCFFLQNLWRKGTEPSFQ